MVETLKPQDVDTLREMGRRIEVTKTKIIGDELHTSIRILRAGFRPTMAVVVSAIPPKVGQAVETGS